VSLQSLAVLACLVSPRYPPNQELLLFLSFCLSLLGGFSYFPLIALIFYRLLFLPLKPGGLTPPYWISMGAAAISTLAGATLVAALTGSRLLPQVLQFIEGATLLFWAVATWWIPLLVILEVWQHFFHKVGFAYSHDYWGLVFPLGMYAACSVHVAHLTRLPGLLILPRAFIYVALAAWSLTFLGLVRWLARSLARGQSLA
jgi:tellurite resistance protein TehA-like permease